MFNPLNNRKGSSVAVIIFGVFITLFLISTFDLLIGYKSINEQKRSMEYKLSNASRLSAAMYNTDYTTFHNYFTEMSSGVTINNQYLIIPYNNNNGNGGNNSSNGNGHRNNNKNINNPNDTYTIDKIDGVTKIVYTSQPITSKDVLTIIDTDFNSNDKLKQEVTDYLNNNERDLLTVIDAQKEINVVFGNKQTINIKTSYRLAK